MMQNTTGTMPPAWLRSSQPAGTREVRVKAMTRPWCARTRHTPFLDPAFEAGSRTRAQALAEENRTAHDCPAVGRITAVSLRPYDGTAHFPLYETRVPHDGLAQRALLVRHVLLVRRGWPADAPGAKPRRSGHLARASLKWRTLPSEVEGLVVPTAALI